MPSTGSRTSVFSPRSPAMDVGHVGGDQRLVEDRGDAVLPGLGLDLGDPGRGRLGVRAQSADPDLGQAVALGQVAEGRVRGDELGPLAVLQPGAGVLLAEGGQVALQGLGVGGVVGRPLGVDSADSRSATAAPMVTRFAGSSQTWGSSPLSSACSRPVVVLVAVPGAEVLQRDHRGRVQGVVPVALGDRLVHGRLERPLVDDQVGVDDARGLPRGQLDVVRLAARVEVRLVTWPCGPATRSATNWNGYAAATMVTWSLSAAAAPVRPGCIRLPTQRGGAGEQRRVAGVVSMKTIFIKAGAAVNSATAAVSRVHPGNCARTQYVSPGHVSVSWVYVGCCTRRRCEGPSGLEARDRQRDEQRHDQQLARSARRRWPPARTGTRSSPPGAAPGPARPGRRAAGPARRSRSGRW